MSIILRGKTIEYDSANHKVLVQFAGNGGVASIPAADWLPAAIFDSLPNVAAILFDENNPSDGLVIGSYGNVAAVAIGINTYTAPTGTATRSGFATGAVTLAVLAEHVKALIDDLRTSKILK